MCVLVLPRASLYKFFGIFNYSNETVISTLNSDLQISFEKSHIVSDHLFILWTIIEQASVCKQDLNLSFIDLPQAYDRANKTELYQKLQEIASRNVRVIINQYDNVEYSVLMENGTAITLKSTLGLKQGDNLGPRLNLLTMKEAYLSPFFYNACLVVIYTE